MGIVSKSTYLITVYVGIHSHLLCLVECLLSTGANSNLIAKVFLFEHCSAHRQSAGNVYLRTAFNDSIDVIMNTTLHACIWDSLMKATFHIIEKLVFNCLFGSSFVDRNVLVILTKSKNVLSCNSKRYTWLDPITTHTDKIVSMVTASEATPSRVIASKRQVELHAPGKRR